MKLHSFLTCIASLALCDPVAGASSWAFDTGLLVDNGSCSQRYLAVLEPALARATTIAKNTNTWLSVNPSPNFARALLRWDSKYARSVFGGGEIQMYGYDETIPGIADFTGRMSWSDPGRWGSAMRPAKNLAIYCNAENVAQKSENGRYVMFNKVSQSNFGGRKPPCDETSTVGSAMIISHYDVTRGVNYWFICPWWLEIMASDPQMFDTRTTIYTMREKISLNHLTLDEWRALRHGRYTRSDSFPSMGAVDILLLNALMHTYNGGLRKNTDRGEYSVGPSLVRDWSYLAILANNNDPAVARWSLPYTFIAIAVFGYQTGFNTDLRTGNYTELLPFDGEDDFGSPDGEYHDQSLPTYQASDPYPPPPPYTSAV